MMGVGARRQHGVELLTGGRLHVAQKALLFRHAAPAALDRDAAAVGQREGRDVERVAEGVLGNMRVRIAVHAAARIGGDLLDLDDARAEPAHRRRLHRIAQPAVERRDDRARQRRRGLHRDLPEGADGVSLRRPERRRGRRWRIGWLRIRRRSRRRVPVARRIGRCRRIAAAARLRHAFGRQVDIIFLRGNARRGQRDRAVRRRGIGRLARRRIRIASLIVSSIISLIISPGRRCRRRARNRPARLIADIAGRPQAFVGKAETGDVVAERRHFQRIFRAAHAGTGDRVDPDQVRALLDRAGLQASDFGLGTPWFALGGLKKSAATTR